MNYYTMMSSDRSLPCTKQEFEEIKALLDANNESDEPCGIDCEYDGGEVYVFGEECAQPGLLPDGVTTILAKLLKRAGVPYLEFGLAFYGDRPAADSCGGTRCRLIATGQIVDPKMTWPKRALSWTRGSRAT